ncbi:MAG TPA: HDIG domain-containing metalloprotein [Anaerolineae bacterium]
MSTQSLSPTALPKLTRVQYLFLFLIGAGLVLALTVIFLVSFGTNPAEQIEPRIGQPSPLTIVAPERLTYPSQIDTQAAQDRAAALVTDVYSPPDENRAREQLRSAQRVLAYVDTVRQDPYSRGGDKIDLIRAVPSITLPADTISRTLALEDDTYHRVVSETLYVLELAMRDEIRDVELTKALNQAGARVSLTFSPEDASLIAQWARLFIVPNSFADLRRTEANRQRARESVGNVYRTIEKNQAVVRANEVITPQIYEALRAMGYVRPPAEENTTEKALALSIALTALSALFLLRFQPGLFTSTRYLLLFALLLTATLLGFKAIADSRSVLPYFYPSVAAIMLVTVLLGSEAALGFTFVTSIAVGFIFQGSLELAVFTLVGGLAAIISLHRVQRLSAFVVAGAYVGLANLITLILFRWTAGALDVSTLPLPVLAAAANGALAGLFALGSLFLLGKAFGIITPLELVELARPTQPLLQKFLREAPGTYHHTLIVGNLAEHAAEQIGADSLLVRVGAYYHDIGKMMNPSFFVENQFDGVNPHDELNPHESALIVRKHVTEGIALAKKYRLPQAIRKFIPEHHGTNLVTYFYRRALERGEAFEELDYRYPGPKPQSRETAILMLADGVEATVRSERTSDPVEIRALIDRLVQERVLDGQLDHADLTLRDLELVKHAFLEVLQGIYHPRIRYPEPPHAKRKSPARPAPVKESAPTTAHQD